MKVATEIESKSQNIPGVRSCSSSSGNDGSIDFEPVA